MLGIFAFATVVTLRLQNYLLLSLTTEPNIYLIVLFIFRVSILLLE